MKKSLLFFLIVFSIIFFFKPYFVYATEVHGLDCGIAGDKKGANKCCSVEPMDCTFFSFLHTILFVVPGVGGWLDQAKNTCEKVADFQKKYPGIKCLYGEEKIDSSGKCVCDLAGGKTKEKIPEIAEMCKKYLNMTSKKELTGCMDCASHGFWTAIGCIPLTLTGFISYLFSFGISLAGIVALLCIIYSAFQLQTSSANPEKIKNAQERLTSCILGLLLIIFSIFILKLIGVDILRIPGFGTPS